MLVECYRQQQLSCEDTQALGLLDSSMLEEEIAWLEQQKARVERLGLAGQVVLCFQRLTDLRDAQRLVKGTHPDLFYPQLSVQEYIIWMKFLPSRYPFAVSNGNLVDVEGYGYSFDLIPPEALDELEFALGLGLFTDYILRTPEAVPRRDPALFGAYYVHAEHGYRRYLLARWGESLLPFTEITRAVNCLSARGRSWWRRMLWGRREG